MFCMKKIYNLNFNTSVLYKIVLSIILLVMLGFSAEKLQAQIYTMESCTVDIGSTSYVIYSTSTANAVSRNATIYPASQLASVANQTLTQLYLERTSATGSLSGPANLKIYLKEVTISEWPAGALDWASSITGATLLYNGDPGTIIGSTAGWKGFPFSSNFVYTGGANNLALFLEYSGPTTSSSSISWTYEYGSPCISTTNSNTTRYSNVTTGILPASLSTTNYRRPYIGFDLILTCFPPTNLTYTSANGSSATISWTAPTAAPAGGYEYYSSTSATAPTTATPATGSTAPGVTSVNIGGLTQNVANYIWVRSVCSGSDKSPWTNKLTYYTSPDNDEPVNAIMLTQAATCANVSGTTLGATQSAVPETCTGLADDDVWYSFEATSTDAKIDLSTVVAATGSSTTDYFQVFSGDANNLVSISCQTSSSGIIGGLNPGETYFIRVYTSLNTSTINFNICVTELAAVPATCPTLSAPAAGGTVNTTPNLDWNTSTNASGYNIYLDGNNPPTSLYQTVYNNNVTEFQVTTPLPTGVYYWYVESFNSLGNATTCATVPRMFTVINPPANDEAAAAIALTVNADLNCGSVTSGTTSGASESPDPAPSCSSAGINDDVWYTFVASSVDHRISFISPSTTTAAALYTGTPGSLSFVTGACASTTLIASGLTIGQTYYVRVYSTSAVTSTISNFDICVGTPPAAPANDEAAGAISLVVNPDINCTSVTSGTTFSATESTDAAPTCSATGINDDVWYTFTATSSAHNISVSGTSSTTAIALYTGTPGSLLFINSACASTTLEAGGLTSGVTYYVRVYTTTSVVSTNSLFDICVSTLPTPVPNDECNAAITLTVNADLNCGVTTFATTVGATQSTGVTSPTCGATGVNDDIWYKFTATASSHAISLISDSGSTDRAMQLYSGTCGSLVNVSCSDPETMTVGGLNIGETYILRVYTFSSLATTRSNFYICIGTPPAPPANDEASGAIALTVNAAIDCAVTTDGTTVSSTASADAAPSCSATGTNDDVWYTFVATGASHLISFSNVSTGTIAGALYSGTPGSLSFITGACASTNLLATGLTGGETYYLRAYTTSSTASFYATFTVCVGTPLPPPANDEIVTAISLTVNPTEFCTQSTAGTTSFATQSDVLPAPTCSATGRNDDVWYSFVATETQHTVSVFNESSTLAVVVYSEPTPGNYAQVSCASSVTTATGLTIGNTFYVRVYTTSSVVTTFTDFSICVSSVPTTAPVNDEANGAIALTVNGGCTAAAYSNTLATQSATEVFPACKGTTGYNTVWFSFVAPASGFVKVSNDYNLGSMGTDTRMAVYTTTNVNDYTTFTSIACDDDNGITASSRSMAYLNGLVPGATYYIQVSGNISSTATGTFCITVDEFNPSMLSGSPATCTTGQSLFSYLNSYGGSLSLVDNVGNLRAMLKRNNVVPGTSTSSYSASLSINSGAVRQDGRGAYYLDRNLFISNSTATDVDVKLFFTDAELAALIAADPSISLANLGITKQSGTTCTPDFTDATGTVIKLPVLNTGSANGVNWVEFNTPDFSNFFVNKAGVTLPITLEYFKGFKQNKTQNQLSWKVDCANAVNNTIVLERSADQQNFTAIQSITTQATDACNQPFNYTDDKANSGMNYYRLKLVDVDGSFKYSNVVALYNGNQAFEMVSLAPNPVKNLTNLKIASDKTVVMNLSVTDIAGKKVSTQKVQLVTGQNVISLDFSKLAAGTYQITGITADATLQTIRFVKQ